MSCKSSGVFQGSTGKDKLEVEGDYPLVSRLKIEVLMQADKDLKCIYRKKRGVYSGSK